MPRRKRFTEDTPIAPPAPYDGPPVKLSEAVLDKIETRLLRAMTGEGGGMDASTMRELRTILKENGRLTTDFKPGAAVPWTEADEAAFQKETRGQCLPGGRPLN